MAEKVVADTYLSANVHHIICDVGLSAIETNISGLDDEGFITWDVISQVLPAPLRPEEETTKYFVDCVRHLSPIFKHIHNEYRTLTEEQFWQNYQPYVSWTTVPQVLKQCFRLAKGNDDTGPLEAVLLSTPVLERSLGDLYLLRERQCPSLLRDLLVTPVLTDILGSVPIMLLRVLIGPPISLNLRNVAWHGFPGPKEIHPQYAYTLLCIIISLGKILSDKNISIDDKHRQPVTFPQITAMQEYGIHDYTDFAVSEFLSLIEMCPFIEGRMKPIWTRAVTLYQQASYSECVSLLLPQLELGLRKQFSDANNCPQRVLTAESTVLFATFDEMLSATLPDGSDNRLRTRLGDSLLTLLLDTLTYPSGPRLRDRISHGESEPAAINKAVASIILTICAVCSLKSDHPPTQLPKTKQLSELVEGYQSLFHPISIVKSKILQCAGSLSQWRHLRRPTNQEIRGCDTDWQTGGHTEQIHDIYSMFVSLYKTHLPWKLQASSLLPMTDLVEVYRTYLNHPINTLFRNHFTKQNNKEDEIVSLLCRIMQQCHLVSQQIITYAMERFGQFENKELRSRQRRTYARMIDSIARLSCGLRLVLMVATVHLYSLDHLSSAVEHKQSQTLRMLKGLLKYCENLLTYTSADKNRWDEAIDITAATVALLRKHMAAS